MESQASTTQITSADHSRSIAERAAELMPYRSAAETISAEDLAIPRMTVGQSTAAAVQDGLVPPGAMYVASDANDPEPVMLHKPGDKTGVLIHPIALRKQWAYTDEAGDFRLADYLAADVPEDAQLAYTFVLLVPEFDPELPVSLMLKSTATQTAKKICLAIKRAEPAPPWSVAFRLTTVRAAERPRPLARAAGDLGRGRPQARRAGRARWPRCSGSGPSRSNPPIRAAGRRRQAGERDEPLGF